MFKSVVESYFTFQFLFVTFSTLLVGWYLYYCYCFTYWKKKGVPFRTPIFPAADLTNIFYGRTNIFVEIQNIHRKFKVKGHKHVGLYFFNGPVYLPIDPKIIKDILTTDFEYFTDRGMYYDEVNAPLSVNLFSMPGQKWKNLRIKLSPTFTAGKLRTMYEEIFLANTKNLIHIMEGAANGTDINIKFILNSFTADIISGSALGLQSNIQTKPNTPIAKIIGKIFHPPLWLYYRCVLEEGYKNPGSIVKAISKNPEVTDFFTKLTLDTIKYREENDVKRNDFLQLLMGVRDKFGLTDNEIIAQCYSFFLAGFETSSSTISFCLHELAHNPEIQDRLRMELKENLGDDYLTYNYDSLLKLPYLEKVLNETLRIYPVVGFLNRICVKPYRIPDTDVVIEKNTPVIISCLGLQRDSDFFPDPLKFDPERFNDPSQIPPFTFMPFGEGPRFCIGMRYGLLQTKLGIAAMVSKYKFLPSPKQPHFYNFDRVQTSLVLSRKDGLYLRAVKA